jgi:hypothetical protein
VRLWMSRDGSLRSVSEATHSVASRILVRPCRVVLLSRTAARSLTASLGGSKQFDWVAGRILQQNLLAAEVSNDLVAEMGAHLFERRNLRVENIYLELNPVPAAGFRAPTIRHRLGCASRPPARAQQQVEVSARHNLLRLSITDFFNIATAEVARLPAAR